MDTTDADRIRETIRAAQQFESEFGLLRQTLDNDQHRLHQAIELPAENSTDTLINFINAYVDHVPDFIEAIANVTHNAGIYEYADTFLSIAKDYFLNPPEVVTGHKAMDALMDEAYLAHRLMEEINDRFIARCGIPLAPMDMTRANLVMHNLIGDSFSNELDMAVQYSVEVLMAKESVFEDENFKDYVETHRQTGWANELAQWPCLAADLDIKLSFSKDMGQKTKLH